MEEPCLLLADSTFQRQLLSPSLRFLEKRHFGMACGLWKGQHSEFRMQEIFLWGPDRWEELTSHNYYQVLELLIGDVGGTFANFVICRYVCVCDQNWPVGFLTFSVNFLHFPIGLINITRKNWLMLIGILIFVRIENILGISTFFSPRKVFFSLLIVDLGLWTHTNKTVI